MTRYTVNVDVSTVTRTTVPVHVEADSPTAAQHKAETIVRQTLGEDAPAPPGPLRHIRWAIDASTAKEVEG